MVGLIVIAILVVYALIARTVVRFFTDDIEPRSRGSTWRLVGYAIAAILPFADVIYGRARLLHLCSTDAYTRAVDRIVLPKAYFDVNQKPTFTYRSDGVELIDWERVKTHLIYSSEVTEYATPRIKKTATALRNSEGMLLGETVSFSFAGGWIPDGASPLRLGAGNCRKIAEFHHLIVSRLVPISEMVSGGPK